MPYEIRRIDGEWCVVKQDTDRKIGCHPTEEKAKRQMAALYANEGKALLPIKAQVMAGDEETAWFAGKVPRRLLAIPFGGPIPSPMHTRGVDLDGDLWTVCTWRRYYAPDGDVFYQVVLARGDLK